MLDNTGLVGSTTPVVDLGSLAPIMADHRADTGRHLVLDGRRGRHRLWLRGSDLIVSPLFLLPGDASFNVRSLATQRLYRLMAGLSSQRRPAAMMPTAYQWHRLIQLLRLLDAEAEGLARREMACRILHPGDPAPSNSAWKASHERRRLYRMLSDAHRLCATGYRTMLQHRRVSRHG